MWMTMLMNHYPVHMITNASPLNTLLVSGRSLSSRCQNRTRFVLVVTVDVSMHFNSIERSSNSCSCLMSDVRWSSLISIQLLVTYMDLLFGHTLWTTFFFSPVLTCLAIDESTMRNWNFLFKKKKIAWKNAGVSEILNI